MDAFKPNYADTDAAFDARTLTTRYPNYLDLLAYSLTPDDSMDAIIVPAARSAEHIQEAASLAKRTGTLLIALCSHAVTSHTMADTLDNMSVPHWQAVDVPPGYEIPSIKLTSAANIPEFAQRITPSNLSDKRNAGVAAAKMLGWSRILFNDDDIVVGETALRSTSLMLSQYKIAGMRCGGFPDKAVIDHAEEFIIRYHYPKGYRGSRAGHISANSVGVNPQTSGIFFPPKIYNEDLFAFYDMYREHSAALIKEAYYQADFDPFAHPDRARTEEFGEILTHGLYRHLSQHASIELTDERYWKDVIVQRGRLIEYLIKGLDAPRNRQYFSYMTTPRELRPETRTKLINSLLAALAVTNATTGSMCIDYYRAWRDDQKRWQTYLKNMPQLTAIHEALDFLQLQSVTASQ